MYCNNLEIQQHGKKLKVEDSRNDDSNHDNQEQVLHYDFWNEAPDDVLMEIFIRHPDCRSAARTTLVCRRWRSLISRSPQFIERLNSHHHGRNDSISDFAIPWTIMFRDSRFHVSYFPCQTLLQLYSDEWVFLHGKLPSANCFDFLPSLCSVIKASCNDLFLLSPNSMFLVSPNSRLTDDRNYICNPITKQFAKLPPIPRLWDTSIYDKPFPLGAIIGYGIIIIGCSPSGPTSNVRFKVVEVLPPHDYRPSSLDPNFSVLPVTVFCSESKKWETRIFPCPGLSSSWYGNNSIDIVTCNGVLYWLHNSGKRMEIVVYLDLSKDKCGTISIPSWTGDVLCQNRIRIVPASCGLYELRLLQVGVYEHEIFPLKVWRLNNNNYYDDDHNDDGSNWLLVHNRMLERPMNSMELFPLRGVFFHPTNGDLVFVVWGRNVVEYSLVDVTYNKKIGEFRTEVSWPVLTPFQMVRASNLSNLDFLKM